MSVGLTKKRWREANKARIAAQVRAYRLAHPEMAKKATLKWRLANREKMLSKIREYYQTHRVERVEYSRNYRKAYPEKVNEAQRKWTFNQYRIDPCFRLRRLLRSRLRHAIRNEQKVGSAVRDLGCTIPELKTYLESKFQPGMTWENWGPKGWHVDHVKSLASFDLTNRQQFLAACHYTNLQPLWAQDNLQKSDR